MKYLELLIALRQSGTLALAPEFDVLHVGRSFVQRRFESVLTALLAKSCQQVVQTQLPPLTTQQQSIMGECPSREAHLFASLTLQLTCMRCCCEALSLSRCRSSSSFLLSNPTRCVSHSNTAPRITANAELLRVRLRRATVSHSSCRQTDRQEETQGVKIKVLTAV